MVTVRTHTSLDLDLLAEIARDQGTPTYVYDGRMLDAGVHRWVDAVGDPGRSIAAHDVEAYGFVMASNYNARPRPAEILVDDTGWRVVRFRETLEDLWRGEIAG